MDVELSPDSPEIQWARKQALDLIAGEVGLSELEDKGKFLVQRNELLRVALHGRSEPERYALIFWLGLFGCAAVRLVAEHSELFDDPMDVVTALDAAVDDPESSH